MIEGTSGYELTTHWIKEIFYSSRGYNNALVTLTRNSLNYPDQIIQEYLKWGIFNIPLRPISVLGFAGKKRDLIGITAEQFLDFYRYSLDYMIELTEITGNKIAERMAKVCLQKIFYIQDGGYMDMRSPCGAGCGQLAYFYDGSVYTCDEARMLGDDAFRLGNVNINSYQELMQSKQMKTSVFASCIDGLYCDYCVYKPYCGVCPVINWKECGSIYAQPKGAFMCKIYEGILDHIFNSLQDKKKAKVIRSWIDNN
jgi:radical SAM protein with 4Fe4S-binding SPASM domain